MRKKTLQKGELLIEALVAMAIVGVIITGIVSSLVYSINNANTAKDQNTATSYAQEGLDIARNLKDSDFTTFSALGGYYYLPKDYTTLDSGNPAVPIDGRFTRQVYVNQSGKDKSGVQKCTNSPSAFVASVVTWSDTRCRSGSDCHKVELNSCFTDPTKIFY